MTPEQVVREIRILRYSPNRKIPLATLAKLAGVGHSTIYEIAENSRIRPATAKRLAETLERIRQDPGQLAISKRRTPITEPPARR